MRRKYLATARGKLIVSAQQSRHVTSKRTRKGSAEDMVARHQNSSLPYVCVRSTNDLWPSPTDVSMSVLAYFLSMVDRRSSDDHWLRPPSKSESNSPCQSV